MAFVFTKDKKSKKRESHSPELNTFNQYVSTLDPSVKAAEFRTFEDSILNNEDKITNKNTSFALFASRFSELYLKIIEPGEEFNGLTDFKKYGWDMCYLFTHDDLDFSGGKDLLFKNQIIDLLRKTGHKILNDFDSQEVHISEVMKPFETEGYEKFWNNVVKILYSGEVSKAVGWFLFNSKEEMLEKKLFNNDYIDSTSKNTSIEADEFSYIMNMGRDDAIVQYTLEDDLGNVISENTMHKTLLEWLKKVYEIDFYKNIILKAKDSNPKNYNPMFYYAYKKSDNVIGCYDHYYDENYRWLALNMIKSENKNTSVVEYFTEHDIKRWLMFLSALLGVRVNLQEEIIQELPTYDKDFSEKMRQECELRKSNFVELREILEGEERKDNEFLQDFLKPTVDKAGIPISSNTKSLSADSVRSQSVVKDFDNVIEDLNSFDSYKVFKGVFKE